MKLGLIGCGKMGRALLGGALKGQLVTPDQVYISSRSPSTVAAMVQEMGVQTAANNVEVAHQCDIVLLCTKPIDIGIVLLELAESPDCLTDTILVSAAAGITLSQLEDLLPRDTKVVRCMPNTPALIGQGAAAYTVGTEVTASDAAAVCSILQATGSVIEVPEKLMSAVTGVSGSSPAYVYTFIEALADGGVAEGLPRQDALELAVKTVQGAAAMIAETGLHPAILRDMVTSPGGTTIEALASLEKNGFRHAVLDAVRTASQKSQSMEKATQ